METLSLYPHLLLLPLAIWFVCHFKYFIFPFLSTTHIPPGPFEIHFTIKLTSSVMSKIKQVSLNTISHPPPPSLFVAQQLFPSPWPLEVANSEMIYLFTHNPARPVNDSFLTYKIQTQHQQQQDVKEGTIMHVEEEKKQQNFQIQQRLKKMNLFVPLASLCLCRCPFRSPALSKDSTLGYRSCFTSSHHLSKYQNPSSTNTVSRR